MSQTQDILPENDHRRIGRELDLFHVQEEAAGSVFWHPNGWTLFRTVEDYIRGRLRRSGYVEVRTPQLVDRVLWQRSGHWDKFRQNMFTVAEGGEEGNFAVKPMNCPCHVQIFNARTVSYRDLPLRMAEFGVCHRNEPSGALHGIMRVRQFTQDDAHIFCTEEQVAAESAAFIALLQDVYRDFGFTEVVAGFSTRPAVRAGTDEMWDRAEAALEEAIRASGLPYETYPGEGAFYGPKLEFALKDTKGRVWQCGTLQLDFVLPERLDAHYTAEDGKRHRPVMLHRAILGSLERFIGILLEHHEGRLPGWLAPVQAAVITIKPEQDAYARHVAKVLDDIGIRATVDDRDENLAQKVKVHSEQRVPVLLVVGAQEEAGLSVAPRLLGQKGKEPAVLLTDLSGWLRQHGMILR